MIVIAKLKHGSDLTKEYLDNGELSTSEYSLEIGACYSVYGIAFLRGSAYYLTVFGSKYDFSLNWNPGCLFEIYDKRIGNNWGVESIKNNQSILFDYIVGFNELMDPKFIYDLMEREYSATSIFLERKEEIDLFNKNISENFDLIKEITTRYQLPIQEVENINKKIENAEFYFGIEKLFYSFINNKIQVSQNDKNNLTNLAKDMGLDIPLWEAIQILD